MKKLLIGLFTVMLAISIVGCSISSGPSKDNKGSDDGTDNTTTSSPAVTPDPAPTYTVTINPSENGTVTASKTSDIAEGETITLTITPTNTEDDDYKLDTLSVKNGDTDISVTNNTFTMPAANVTVSATFTIINYIGTKKPKENKAVGDIVFNDGSAMPFAAYEALEEGNDKDTIKDAAIALIFYSGTELNSDDPEGNADTTTSRTLGVGLKHNRSGLAWCRYTGPSDYANA